MEHSHIAFDSRWSGPHGIGRFATELQGRLNFTCLYSANNHPASMASSFRLGYWLSGSGARALFSPGYVPPSGSKLPFVFTIHDLNHIDVGHNSSAAKKLYYKLIIRPAVHQARQVLTVSEFSRQRIIDWSGCKPEQVRVVGNGVSDSFNHRVAPRKPGFPYFFCCSNRKGHKNEKRLIQAFKHSRLHLDSKLVLTGLADPETLNVIAKQGLETHVVFTGPLSEADLASWYKGAVATVFPSLYEGFGLPVAESMACGTPVVTSRISSMPEVGGAAALYVDPRDIDSIATAMRAVADNVELHQSLKVKGLAQATKFSWDRTAALVSSALQGLSTASNNLQ